MVIPPRVYWHQNQYQYKSSPGERSLGMKSWIALGTDPSGLTDKLNSLKLPSRPTVNSFSWLADWYLRQIAPKHLSSRTILDRSECVKRLNEAFGQERLDSITPAAMQRYIYRRAEMAPRRASMEYSTLKQIYRWACRFGLADSNPATDLWAPPDRPRDRYVSHEELTLFDSLSPLWGGPVALLGYSLGQRLSDLLALRFDETELTFTTQKTRKRARIIMTDELLLLIKRVNPDVQPGELIVTNTNGESYNRHSFGHRWRRCMKRFIEAGGQRFTFHDLKAKFVTDSQSAGLDPVIQALHDNPRTTRIYLRSKESTVVTALSPP